MTYEYQPVTRQQSFGGFGTDSVQAPDRVAPYPRLTMNVAGIGTVCYQGMPRTDLPPDSLPYALEIHPIGTTFICTCNGLRPAVSLCPQEVHQGASPLDPWRREKCNQWVAAQTLKNNELLTTVSFRKQLAKQAMDLVGVPGWRRWFAGPAEFTTVLREKEIRERPIKIVAPMILLASGVYLIWRYASSKKSKTAPVKSKALVTTGKAQTAK